LTTRIECSRKQDLPNTNKWGQTDQCLRRHSFRESAPSRVLAGKRASTTQDGTIISNSLLPTAGNLRS